MIWAKLNEQIDANVSLNKRIGEFVKMEIVNECAAGLAETQKEKTASLAEGVEFETEEDFRNKVNTIKESYFTRKAELAEAAASDPTEEAGTPCRRNQQHHDVEVRRCVEARWSK